MVGLKFFVLLSQIMEDDVNDPDFFSQQRERLATAVCEQGDGADFQPLNISPWLAMSLLQKAIRRREPQFAHRAAAPCSGTLRIGCGADAE
jgi:hypothetical protein